MTENTRITTVIDADVNRPMASLAELRLYRELVWVMVQRDIKVRYKQTVLGLAWAIIQPVTMMLIFTVIFSRLAGIPSDGFPYPLFVFSGMLAWNFFSSSVSTAGVSLVGSSNLVSKVYFPRIIVPLSSIGVGLIDFLVGTLVLLVMFVLYAQSLSLNLILLPFFMAGLALVSIGMGSWLAAVTVTYRDFRYVIPYMLQIWMYLTPVIYPVSFVPENWRWLLYLNPMFAWINGIRACFLGQEFDVTGIIVSLIMSLLIFVCGMLYFNKAQRRFADII
ncbi:MAG: ABC transporter permease [Gammaproteobacteria bacterium]|nr:ABC transporter permease [Gammaproteobacteria bacterium]